MTALSVWLFLVLAFVYGILKFLNLSVQPSPPKLFFGQKEDDSFVEKVLRLCPIFYKPYVPPLLWGKNGHLHTFAFARFSPCVYVKASCRHSVKLQDNSTIIFDIFHPKTEEEEPKSTVEFTIIVVPGIANDSKSSYIQSLCEHLTSIGYRVVVLNHLGVLPLKLTSNRIFTYGSTCELNAMVKFVVNNYRDTKLIGVGFSMGANILVKYLGEKPENQNMFLSAVSVCQGYDVLKASPVLEEWGIRRVYNWLIADRVKQVIKRHSKELFAGALSSNEQLSQRNKVLLATSLQEIDEKFLRQMAGYQTVTEFYSDSSSSKYINNIEIPMLLLNAQDDPLVPDQLLDTPRNYVKRPSSQSLFVLSQFGGHLGFYEGGLFTRNAETWLNKVILQYLNAVVVIKGHNNMKQYLWK